jgi:hypothetical protein
MKTTFLFVFALACVLALLMLPQVRDTAASVLRAGGDFLHQHLQQYMARSGMLLSMATLAADKARNFELGYLQDLPMIGSDIIYEGAAVGDNGSGLARPLVAADPFLGFAERTADNSAGAASALRVRVRTRGQVQLAVTGAASAADVSETVYASDDDTFTLTAGSNTALGKVSRWVSGTTCIVAFEAAYFRSL